MKQFGYASACREYADDLADLKIESRKAILHRWKHEMGNSKVIAYNKDRLPAYGAKVEKDLVSDIVTRNTACSCSIYLVGCAEGYLTTY
jgi:hypothetical protein